jgi:hypothetical protein
MDATSADTAELRYIVPETKARQDRAFVQTYRCFIASSAEHEDAVEQSAVGEIGRLCFAPATEAVDRCQCDHREHLGVFGGNRRIARPVRATTS